MMSGVSCIAYSTFAALSRLSVSPVWKPARYWVSEVNPSHS